MIRSAPRLETERLILRDFKRDDLDSLAETLGDPEVVRHLTAEPISREDSLRRLFVAVGQWPVTGMGMWAVERKSDGKLVGHVGFFDMERDMQPSLIGLPEMGWIFHTSVHGQGIAREACEAALDWLDATHGPIDVPAIISLENTPSLKLAERLGFVREADGMYKGEPIAVVRRSAPRG
ncbi:MAG: GNAT family N-acetyltransferase [Sphingomonas bacterium]|nr:GNAT family N-acetyltransferase [Sphingomonas bacterium]